MIASKQVAWMLSENLESNAMEPNRGPIALTAGEFRIHEHAVRSQ